jgi:hypothetical protein
MYQNKADKHLVDFQGDIHDPLVLRMVERLSRAIASDEYRDKMDVEDEIDRIFERALGEKDMVIAQKDKLLDKTVKSFERSKKQVINANKRTEAEKKRSEVEIQKNIALQKEIELLKKQLNSA